MVKRLIILLILLSIGMTQSTKIYVDKNRIQEGEVLTLSIEVTDGKDFAKVDLGPLENNFEIISGPSQQTNIQWINGNMTSTKTLNWTLLPKRNGLITIPPLKGTIGDKIFKGKKIEIQVGESQNKNSDEIFIIAEIDKATVYLGEQITLKYKLYKRADISIAGIDQFKMPDFIGFWAEEIFTPQRLQFQTQVVTYKGMKYQVANLGERALFPIASDKHNIPSVKVKVQVEVKKKKRSRDPFFDPFFNSFFTETRNKILRSESKTIKIIPFPNNRPFDFTGAVGDFNIEAIVDRNNIKVNDAISLQVNLSGTGNIGLFSFPEIKFPKNIEVFPPTDKFEKDGFRNQFTGSQKWEYILIPRKSGSFLIPRIQMSFFNPILKQWTRISTDPIELLIKPGETINERNTTLDKRDIELLGQDIRYIHTNNTDLKQIKILNTRLLFFLYTISLIVFISPLLVSKITGYHSSNFENRKMRRALKKSLKKLKKQGKDGDPFQIASDTFYLYLKEKLNLSSKNLDPATVGNILKDRLDSKLYNQMIDLLVICDAGRYAPDAIDKENKVLIEMKHILKLIDIELG